MLPVPVFLFVLFCSLTELTYSCCFSGWIRDEVVKAAEQYGETLATLEKGAANGTGVQKGKVCLSW